MLREVGVAAFAFFYYQTAVAVAVLAGAALASPRVYWMVVMISILIYDRLVY